MEKSRDYSTQTLVPFSLIASPDEPGLDQQVEFKAFLAVCRAERVKIVPRVQTRDAIGATGITLDQMMIPLAALGIPAIKAVVVAWIQAAPHRRAKLKAGGIEVEARNAEEAAKLFALADELEREQSKLPSDAQ